MTRPHAQTLTGKTQRGAAALMIVLFLIVVLALTALTVVTMSGSDVNDSTLQHNNVSALFLAESALERASYLLSSGTTCDATLMEGPQTLGAGTFEVAAPTPFSPSAGLCQVVVTGNIGSTTRKIQAQLNIGGSGIAFDTQSSATANDFFLTLTINVGSLPNRILVVGVADETETVNMVYYWDGVTVGTFTPLPPGITNNGKEHVELWYYLAPAVGTVQIFPVLNNNHWFAAGVVSLSGVDQTTPIDGGAVFKKGNNSTTPNVTIPTNYSGDWITDIVANALTSAPTPSVGQTLLWSASTGSGSGGGVGANGASSTKGPLLSAGSQTMSWSLTPPKRWAMGAVALKPAGGGSSSVARWQEL